MNNEEWNEVVEAIATVAIAGKMDRIPLSFITYKLQEVELRTGYSKLLLEQILLEYWGE